MHDNSKLTVLVVDPSPGMRGSLQNMLVQSNITKIEFAVSSGTAIKQLQKKSFDIILCEYDLSGQEDGQDGQQLLEDLRHHRLIGLWTIFIMITSEGIYSKVVSAAELTPTDYVLKPFTVDVLSQRIARAIEKRTAFLPIYQQIGHGNHREAIRMCAAAETATPRYAADFARLRAELHLNLGEVKEAEQTYQAIVAARPMGWASLGLARAMFAQERYAETAEMLSALIAQNPRLMAAYDLLSECEQALGHPQKGQKVLEDAVSISPHVIRRLRQLGAVALEAGDANAAERAYKQVVARARYSEFRDPEDHVNLVRAFVKKRDPSNAATVARDLEKSLRGHRNLDVCTGVAAALVHEAEGNNSAAKADLQKAAEALKHASGVSAGLKFSLTRACLAHRMDKEAAQVMLDALDDVDSGVTVAQAMDVFVKAGRRDIADTMGSALQRQVAQLLTVAAEKSGMGDLKGAVHTLTEALHKAPGNLPVMVALVGAIVRQVNELGWDHALGEAARMHLENIRTLDPAHAELAGLTDSYAAARRRYGIST